MPLLFVCGILAVWAGYSTYQNTCSKTPALDSQTREEISKRMTGKSQKECAKILRQYRK
jgi:hypothetical protein